MERFGEVGFEAGDAGVEEAVVMAGRLDPLGELLVSAASLRFSRRSVFVFRVDPVDGVGGEVEFEVADAAHKLADLVSLLLISALLEQDPGPAPDWAAWVGHTELRIMTGRCLTRVGQPHAAIPAPQAALDEFDAAQARDKALYMSRPAEAYLDVGQIEAATAMPSDALILSAGVASARPAQRLRVLARRLAGQSAVPAVAALLEYALLE